MRNYLTSLFIAGLAVGTTVASFGLTLPSAIVKLGDNETFDASGLFVPTATGYTLPFTTLTFLDGSIVTISASSNSSLAALSYSFGVTNNNGPESYDFSVSAPVKTIGAGAPVTSGVSGSGTDVAGTGGTISPTGTLATVQQAFGDTTNLGVDLGPSYSTDPADPSYTGFFDYGSYNGAGITTKSLSLLDLHLGLDVPGGGDLFSFSGNVVVSATPEPGALALLGSFAVPCTLGLLRRKRNRSVR